MFPLQVTIALISGAVIARAGQAPIGIVDSETTAKCSWWFENRDNTTRCWDLPALYEITPSDFVSWNPVLASPECAKYEAGHAYCVEAKGPATSEPPTSTATANGIATPTPSSPGMYDRCYRFHKFATGEKCATIAKKYGITLRTLEYWNPYAGEDCKYLNAGTNICVGTFQSIPEYTLYGCYNEAYKGNTADTKTRALSAANVTGYGDLSPEWCSAYCLGEMEQTYFGVEGGDQCWCGNDLALGSYKIKYGNCNTACSGNSTQKCGGKDRLLLFGAKDGKKPMGYRPAGCYTEATNARALGAYSLWTDDMSVEKCAEYCIGKKGKKMFNVQEGNQCWCGNALADGSVATSDSKCSTKCAGNGKQVCGGKLGFLSLYTTSQSTP